MIHSPVGKLDHKTSTLKDKAFHSFIRDSPIGKMEHESSIFRDEEFLSFIHYSIFRVKAFHPYI